jgi:beta-galactosidase
MDAMQWFARSFLALVASLVAADSANAEHYNLNDDWAFFRGDQPGAGSLTFDDKGWHHVSVPHDWSIADLPGQSNPFSNDAIAGGSQGNMVGGVGWYRRSITLPADVGKTVLLRFEACYMDCEIWVNGQKLVRHPYGYTAFDLDISAQARAGENVVAVRVNHEEPSSRWYSGSGLIRPVHLEILDKVHVDPVGPYITTPQVSASKATVSAKTLVFNARLEPVQASLTNIVLDRQGHEVRRAETSQTIAPAGRQSYDQTLILSRPSLWSTETPNLYTLVQEVRVGGALVDSRSTRFGARSISFDAKRGCLLNGNRMLLKGGNIHHDNYMLGAAGIPRADRRKVELLKSAGFNAIRNAHNPASQATLDAADELGMLVIDEAFDMWWRPKNKKDYARFFPENWQSDMTRMVASGRNHPSVIMWSIGNEIPESPTPTGVREARQLADFTRSLDPTRPVTASSFIFQGVTDQFMDQALDVAGYNYYPELYRTDHKKFPNRVMYGSESFSRHAFEFWRPTFTLPWVIGDFVWTAFDYLGESGIGWLRDATYPWHLAMSGEIDATGKLRPAAYYRRVLWKTGLTPTSAFMEWPTVEGSLPDGALRKDRTQVWVQEDLVQGWGRWTPRGESKVVVFSEDEEVELFLNGESLGRKPVSVATEYKTSFFLHFEPGELKVVGYKNGKPHSQWVMHSAGKPVAISLTVDRPNITADGDDLAYITAQLVDDKGVPAMMPKDDEPLVFKVSGAGTLAGVGNGNPVVVESFQNGTRSTFWGRAVAVVRASKAPGTIKVEVSGGGLPTTSADIISR